MTMQRKEKKKNEVAIQNVKREWKKRYCMQKFALRESVIFYNDFCPLIESKSFRLFIKKSSKVVALCHKHFFFFRQVYVTQ
jgi:hypothetical protein